MAKLTDADLAAILKRPGYAVRGMTTVVTQSRQAGKTVAAQSAGDDYANLVQKAANDEIEAIFKLQVLEAGFERTPMLEWPPIKGRKFRIDVAFPSWKAEMAPNGGYGFEVQGNVHRVKKNFYADMLRHNTLTEAGWTMFYVGRPHIKDGSALELVRRVICG